MGALIAVVSKEGANVYDVAVTMLETLTHRGRDAFGIASPHKIVVKGSLEELRKERIDSCTLIGHSLAKIFPRDEAQPVKYQDSTLAFDGRLFPAHTKSEVNSLVEKLMNSADKAAHLIRKFNGAYVLAFAEDERIVVGRDAVGTRPLYFGENENLCAVASERKALWKIGIIDAGSFSPGNLAVIDEGGFRFEVAKTITQTSLQRLDLKTAAQKLKQVLLQSTKGHVSDLKEVAVAFSGGIDSSIVAFSAKLCHVDVHLVCVSLEETKESVFAERAATALDLPFYHIAYSIADLEEILPKVLWLIEESNPVNVGIATPTFWVAEQSSKLGLKVLMSGQGGDEAFGGYHRYLEEYERHGSAGLQRKIYRDTVSSYESNFQRDNKVCVFNNVELRTPLTDLKVVQFALGLPTELKINSPQDMLRKRVLREAGRELGIPKFIVEKPKKAIQYTTGVSKAMKELAKKEGLTLQRYLKRIFLKAYGMLG